MSDKKLAIYHNPDCSKSRQTLQLLQENNQNPKIIDYLKQPPNKSLLQTLITKGIPARTLLRSKEYAALQTGLNIDAMSENDIIEAICRQPTLLQRPIVVYGDKAMIGRPPTAILDLFQ